MAKIIATYDAYDVNKLIGKGDYLLDMRTAYLGEHEDYNGVKSYQWLDAAHNDYDRALMFYKTVEEAEQALAASCIFETEDE